MTAVSPAPFPHVQLTVSLFGAPGVRSTEYASSLSTPYSSSLGWQTMLTPIARFAGTHGITGRLHAAEAFSHGIGHLITAGVESVRGLRTQQSISVNVTKGDDGFLETTIDCGKNVFIPDVVEFGLEPWSHASMTTKILKGWKSYPLWVRRDHRGTSFHFSLPTDQALPPSRYRFGDVSSLDRRLGEGYVVPVSTLDLAIARIIDEIPPKAIRDGVKLHRAPPDADIRLDDHELLLQGDLRYPRFEVFHRLLSGLYREGAVRAVDNGPGSAPDIALVLAGLGSCVSVKEPSNLAFMNHVDALERHAPQHLQQRIHHVPQDKIDEPLPRSVEVVYWGPPHVDLVFDRQQFGSVEAYFGRDVAKGGFLVVQTDSSVGLRSRLSMLEETYRLHNLRMDEASWVPVFSDELSPSRSGHYYQRHFLPTVQEEAPCFILQVYYRKRT